MILPPEQRPPRPRGVTVLGWVLLLLCAATAACAVRMVARHPAELLRANSLLYLALQWVLPAVWLGATGAGLLAGGGWARNSFFAIAALSLVVLAGRASRPLETRADYLGAGGALSVALVAAGGVWYLLGEKVKGWFR